MKYDNYLLKILKNECPFCDINKNYILEKWKYFSVILARAPYVRDHLLIVPNRHLIRLSELTIEEQKNLIPLLEKWTKKLEKIHSEVNILIRDWFANWIIWKSINHLHIHLIPDHSVHCSALWWSRSIYSDYQLTKKTIEFKNKIKWK
jgi:diadenosine tetraphosphate (Ap4A) HIT family hydrolase